jgi:ribonuclease HI
MTLYRNELQNKIDELQKEFAGFGVDIFFDDSSFRDYLAIVELSKNLAVRGKLFIYYKPSQKTYSLKKQIKDAAFEKVVDAVWSRVNNSEHYSSDSGIYEAFVDGSFIDGKVGWGSVIYLGDALKAKLSGSLAYTEFRQFGGELKSVVEVIRWCKKNKVSKIRINYDYEGIEKFATDVWKPKNELSKKYADYVKKSALQIEWRHIKSHTGNAKNDEADKLAKKAALNAAINLE